MKTFTKKTILMLYAPLWGILASVILIAIFAEDPADAFSTFFAGTFTSKYYFGNFLNTQGFLIMAGTGAAISIISGNMNLGGEGQIYIGGFTGCLILNFVKGPSFLVFTLALTAALLSGALLACFSALLKELRGAEVLLTTFLVSSATIPLVDGLITASKNAVETNLLALPYINESFRFHQILSPSPLTFSFFIAIIISILAWLYIEKSEYGKRMKIWGQAPQFAKYCGYSSKANSYCSLAVSGALNSFTGFCAVCGTYYTCLKDFYTGLGWNALSTSLIASSNPIAIIPVSFIMSWLYTSCDRVSLTQGFTFDISGIIQGAVLFSIAAPLIIKKILTRKGR